MMSLERQRQSIESKRTTGVVMVVFGACVVALGIAVAASGSSYPWGLVIFGYLLISGILRVRDARRALAAFESEHGVGAGVQRPIR